MLQTLTIAMMAATMGTAADVAPIMDKAITTIATSYVDARESYEEYFVKTEVERSFKFIYNEKENEVWLNFSNGYTVICSSGKDLSKAIETHTDYAAVCSIEHEMIVLIKDNYAIGIDIDRRSYEKEAYE